MTATLQLRRQPGMVMELWRGTYHVLLDGTDIATIDSRRELEHPIEPGPHTLQVAEGRYTSPRRSFIAGDGEVVSFNCNGSRIWPVYLASLIVPSLALALRQE